MGITYLRHRNREPFGQKMGPLGPDHRAAREQCIACGVWFSADDLVTLIPLGPGDDPEEQEKARAGRWYNAVAAIVHWDCAGLPEEEVKGE